MGTPKNLEDTEEINPKEKMPVTNQQVKIETMPEQEECFVPDIAEIFDPDIANKNREQQEKKQALLKQEQIHTLFSQLKKKTDALKELVTLYYDEKGYDYVLWNIRYTNSNAHKNYSSFFKMALEKDGQENGEMR